MTHVTIGLDVRLDLLDLLGISHTNNHKCKNKIYILNITHYTIINTL